MIVVAAIHALDVARTDERYRSHVEFAMDVVLPSAHWDAEIAALPPDEAIQRSAAFAESAAVRGPVDDELGYDHHVVVDVVDDHTLRFTAEADEPSLAVNAATASAAIFGQQRAQAATRAAEEALPSLRGRVAATTGAERDVATGRLSAAEDTIRLGPAGAPTGDATTPCCPTPRPWAPAIVRGGLLGLLLGAALVGLSWLEQRRLAAITTTGGPARRRPIRWRAGASRPWVGPAVVSTLVAGRALVYAAMGPRFILDDWLILYRREYLGVADAIQHSRLVELPVKWLTQTVIFGLSGDHPLVLFALVTVLNLGAALALYYAIARFFPPPVPLLVAGLWVLTANHSTLTVWAAASQGVMAVALCCVGVTLLSRGRWLAALAALTGSMLSYELTIPICITAAAVVGTRLVPNRADAPIVRQVRRWQRAVMVGWLVAVVGWMTQHPTYPIRSRRLQLWDTWSGHVSSGLLSTDAAPSLLLRALEVGIAVGAVLCLVAWARGDRGRTRGPALVLYGLVVMGLGLATTVLVPGGTVGLFNRLYGASSVGTAMLLVGIVLTVWRRLRTVGAALAIGLVSLCVVGQVIALRAVHDAGEDVLALLRHLEQISDDPADTSFLVEPRPEHDGFYAIDQFFGLYPYKLAFPDGRGNLRLAADSDEFDQPEPGEVQVRWEDVLDPDR